ncbi:MAG: peptide chain release factor 1, partial [Candidatus Hydrothermota bacterium]
SRLYDLKRSEQEEKLDRIRRSYLGTGDRSEKIRTYNFPQNRVTDHRIGLSLHNLEEILDGELDPLIEALLEEEERRRLEEIGAF